MPEIDQLIDRHFDALSPELQRAARWLRQDGPMVALQSMRDCARDAGVAPVTMTRLARRLGFESFEQLRAPYARRLEVNAPRPRVARASALGQQLAALNQVQQDQVRAVLVHNTEAQLRAAASALLSATRVAFLGLRMSHGAAFQLHYGHGLLAANGHLLTDLGGTLADQVATLGPGQLLVAISQSPYTRATVTAVQQAQAQGCSVLALSDSPLSPIARHAARTLIYGGGSSGLLHATSGALALIDTLLACVVHVGGDAVQQHWQRRQRQLARDHAYWETPKDTP